MGDSLALLIIGITMGILVSGILYMLYQIFSLEDFLKAQRDNALIKETEYELSRARTTLKKMLIFGATGILLIVLGYLI